MYEARCRISDVGYLISDILSDFFKLLVCMSLRHYLIIMSFGTSLCWLSWGFIVYSLDPFKTSAVGLLFFYLTLFLALVGSFSVAGFMIKRLIVKQDEVVFRHVRRTFRQSVIVAALFVAGLLMLAEGFLTWWNALILLALGLALEAIIFSNRKYRNPDYYV